MLFGISCLSDTMIGNGDILVNLTDEDHPYGNIAQWRRQNLIDLTNTQNLADTSLWTMTNAIKKMQHAINISFPISNTNLETGVGFLQYKKSKVLQEK